MKFITATLVLAFMVGFSSSGFAEQTNCEWAEARFTNELKGLMFRYEKYVPLITDLNVPVSILEIEENLLHQNAERTAYWGTVKIAACQGE